MADIDVKDLFASEGALADITADEWKGGWVSIVGGLHGRPTAQQFNMAFNAIQAMIAANSRSIAEVDKKTENSITDKTFTRESIVDKIADGTLVKNLNAEMLGGHKADYFAPAASAFSPFCFFMAFLSFSKG